MGGATQPLDTHLVERIIQAFRHAGRAQ
jgi:hypothetical protein